MTNAAEKDALRPFASSTLESRSQRLSQSRRVKVQWRFVACISGSFCV